MPTQLWFTSDWHLFHANIINFEKRPFNQFKVEDMNWKIVNNFNKRVKLRDIVYFLGDFAFMKDQKKLWPIAEQLHGKWTFIMGNHDYTYKLRSFFEEFGNGVYDFLVVQWKNEKIALMHYPMYSWPGSHYGSWHLYGHVHSRTIPLPGKRMNVSVDVTSFWPVSFDEVKAYMDKQLSPEAQQEYEESLR